MKHIHLEQEFDRRFEWYQDNRREGAYYPAILTLAELENCLEALPKNAQVKWKKRINHEPLTNEIVRLIEPGIAEAIEKIRRIVSFGTRWCFEELTLVLGMRIEIEMALLFLQKRCYLTKHHFRLDELDETIRAIARSRTNERDFRMAVTLYKRNKKLPLRSSWLNY